MPIEGQPSTYQSGQASINQTPPLVPEATMTGDELAALLDRQVRANALEVLTRDLANSYPLCVDAPICFFCGQALSNGVTPHLPECLWLRANRLAGDDRVRQAARHVIETNREALRELGDA